MKKYDSTPLGNLISIAIGSEKHASFASRCGVSAFYLSKLLNGKHTTRPSARLLGMIADASEGRVTKEALLKAAGFPDAPERTSRLGIPDVRPLAASILTALYEKHVYYSLLPSGRYDLSLLISRKDNLVWNFLFVSEMPDPVGSAYSHILFQDFAPGTKVSFVTDSAEVFASFTKSVPSALDVTLSVVHVSRKGLRIAAEKELLTSGTAPEEISGLSFL